MLNVSGRSVLFVGGKGGVGKTTTASAIALRLAAAGKRVLLVSTDPAHSLGDLFGVTIGSRGKELAPNLTALEIDPELEADRYIGEVTTTLHSLVHPDMYHEIDRQMKLARAAPGGIEAAMLERVAGIIVDPNPHHEVVVFDTAPTGQTLRLLALPEIMTAWTDGLLRRREKADEIARAMRRFGKTEQDHFAFMDPMEPSAPANEESGTESGAASRPGAGTGDSRLSRIRELLQRRRDTFARARDILLDSKRTGFIIVLNPERLPILESAKAVKALREFGIAISGIVINRVLPEDEPGEFLAKRRARESAYLALIESEFPGIPKVKVPLQADDSDGREAIWDGRLVIGE